MANKKPYKYDAKHRVTKNRVTPKREEERFEATTRIRVDKERLDDLDSLDTSFLEGRLDTQVKKKKKEKRYKEKRNLFANFDFEIIKNIFISLITIVLVVGGIIFLVKNNFFLIEKEDNTPKEEEKVKKKVKEKKKSKIDDNYLFVGDFYTEQFNFDDLDYHYVKSSSNEKTTSDVKDNLNSNIYKYNPSIIFIELGMIDLSKEKDIDEIKDNIKEIIEKIKENRPYAKIYLESIYPINRDIDDFKDEFVKDSVDNKKIKEINKKLKEVTKDTKINYLDIYKLLEDDGKLNEKYTDNGSELNEEGYKKILKEIKKVVDDDEEED